MLASIIIPVYNESDYIIGTLKRCLDLDMDKELIVVDNDSTDDSFSLVRRFIEEQGPGCPVTLLTAGKKGKGNAVRAGLKSARGSVVIFQDADSEYDPAFIPKMVEALRECDAVHGVRVCRPYEIGVGPFLANKLLLRLVNRKDGKRLLDIFTGQRGYRREVLESIDITSEGFELETELAVRVLDRGYRIKEIDVRYRPRSRKQGKKIGILDLVSICSKYFLLSREIGKERGVAMLGAHKNP